jgi:hypothetical protein
MIRPAFWKEARMLDGKEIQAALRTIGVRVEEEMASYVARQLQAGAGTGIAILGGDARTGVPVRRIVAAEELMRGNGAARL